ncbi:MAG: hypothetical protein L0216_21025, partial [Planctomycetales bacterium]|nr:hypothetical protein [Planctomycetales bacterium]
IERALDDRGFRAGAAAAAERLRREWTWERAAEPLRRLALSPRRAPDRRGPTGSGGGTPADLEGLRAVAILTENHIRHLERTLGRWRWALAAAALVPGSRSLWRRLRGAPASPGASPPEIGAAIERRVAADVAAARAADTSLDEDAALRRVLDLKRIHVRNLEAMLAARRPKIEAIKRILGPIRRAVRLLPRRP